jgi:hypothetical protein
MHHYFKDPRARFIHEEPKPNHSYIGLIAMAILSSRDKKLVLSDIYQWILDNYPYFRTRGPGWRNSIRSSAIGDTPKCRYGDWVETLSPYGITIALGFVLHILS